MTARHSEVVSLDHERIGRINQTDRGFELFDANDRYMHTEVTLAGTRKAIFERHRDQHEAVKA